MVSATSSSLSPKSAHTLSKSSMAEKTQRGGQEREKEEREWEREREKERGERETGEWKNEIILLMEYFMLTTPCTHFKSLFLKTSNSDPDTTLRTVSEITR